MARTATAAKPQTTTQKPPAQQTSLQPGAASVPATQTNAPAIVQFKTYMDQRMGEIELALPPHMTAERFGRVVLTALQRNPGLLKCTRQSLFNACMLAAQDGLLPDGREGAIAPYGVNEQGKKVAEIATWMPMIEGLRKKARNSGDISDWMVRIAYQRDEFEVFLGDDERIVHRPYLGSEDPGVIIAAYSIARLKDGTISREVMPLREIKKIEAKSKAASGPWKDATFFPEMCKKTVARRHYKQLPHSAEMDDFIRRLDEAEGMADVETGAEARQHQRVASTTAAFDAFAGADKGTVIEHQPEPEGQQQPEGGQTPDQQQTGDAGLGDFNDDTPEQEDAGAADAGEPEADTTATAGEATGDAATIEGTVSEVKEVPTWPEGKVPTNPEEYKAYGAAYIAKATDAAALAGWFKGADERKLRNACGVQQDVFEEVKALATKRIAAIQAAATKAGA